MLMFDLRSLTDAKPRRRNLPRVGAPRFSPAVTSLQSFCKFAPDNFRPRTESVQLASRHVTRQGRHAAVGGRVELVGVDKLQRLAQGIGDFLLMG